jgi:hypothetical protein
LNVPEPRNCMVYSQRLSPDGPKVVGAVVAVVA